MISSYSASPGLAALNSSYFSRASWCSARRARISVDIVRVVFSKLVRRPSLLVFFATPSHAMPRADACACGAHDEECCPAGDGERTCDCDCHLLDHAHCWEIVGLMRAVNHGLDVSQTIGLTRQDLLGTGRHLYLSKKQVPRFYRLAQCHYGCFSAPRKKPSASKRVPDDVERLSKSLLAPTITREPSLFDRALQRELTRVADDPRRKKRRRCEEESDGE